MNKPYLNKTILLADDEPTNLDWLIDFIKRQGCEVEISITASDAIERIKLSDYRAIIVDLNIPFGSARPSSEDKPPIYYEYPGLQIAQFSRNEGNDKKRVIVYSVYQSDDLANEISKFDCEYISKQRPKIIKNSILSVLSYDPKNINKN